MTQVSMAALIAAARASQLISFPTDTVPALAARSCAADAIYAAKGRQRDKPLILMAATPADLWSFVQGSPEERANWQRMAQRYWPGAVTLVLPASERVSAAINANSGTIGLRIPAWPIAQTILQQTGPLVTTSINKSGHPPLLSAVEIQAQFPKVCLLRDWQIPDSVSPVPSTVIQWTSSHWTVLRQGKTNIEGL